MSEQVSIECFKTKIMLYKEFYKLHNINLAYKQVAQDLMQSENFDEDFDILFDAYDELESDRIRSEENAQ
ncbi:hypothetical protein QU593_10125 [Rossellomorea marisflavi]|uniref:hypothetical protein n=1 Tax=Rossellomorea marisflavi TaxID=189381 RepID=UPI0025B06DC0|nr:hypothetical protein [Rossellomorea marisflavi]WJV20761.1 hypothetical protein QU593_10125 [Rossellomorea marisflavi]